jgi:DNA invertase Pin-like site-specific DNA recombinase
MDNIRLILPFSPKESENAMKKRVYTLYRVSTKGQVEKDDIPMQKEACRNFAESQGWEIVKEFSEKGVSGFKKSAKERDELQKIQQAAMEGKFDILLVFMFDRLGRRDDETPFIVEWFTKQGIEVWSVNEGQQRFDTHVDKLMNYIRYWQASGESLKTSVRTRTRLEQLTEEGHYTGGTVAFGYKRVRLGRVNKKNQEVCDLVIDEAEAEIVRQIFAQFREVSRKKLLESVKTNDATRIQKKIKKIQKDLEAKQKELDDLKAETILVIRGVSALDKELLGTLVAEAREALETLEKQLVQAQEEYEEATKTAKRSNYICNELLTWADVYDTANHDERRAILQQFIKEIRVRKDYEISITLNASFNQVEQLKSVSIYDGAEIFEEISEKGA